MCCEDNNCFDSSQITIPVGPAGPAGTNGTNGINGTNGTNGTNGINGTNGADGNYGGWASKWIFDSGVTNTPIAQQLRFNNASVGAATKLYINLVNVASDTMTDFLAAFENTISGVNYYGLVRVYAEATPEYNYAYAKITNYVSAAGVVSLDITIVQENGGFTDGDAVIVDFTPNGVTEKPYKAYVALLSQSSTADPTAVVLENELGGTVVWTRDDIGMYSGILTGAFTASKTVILLTLNYAATSVTGYAIRTNANAIMVQTINAANVAVDGKLVSASLEVRVYN